MYSYEFKNSAKIISGDNALEKISYECEMMNCHKPLMLTDAMLHKLGTLAKVQKAIEGIDTSAVFYDVPVDSSIKIIEQIKMFYLDKDCDGIIAVGGGSVIDTGKGLKISLSQNKPIEKLMGAEIMKRGKFVPFIVVPTTSGTGSEATCVAVISSPEMNAKLEFVSYELLPDVAVLDTRMTETLPARLTASTGADALCHAIEAYTCLQKNPLSDAYATSAIKLISENLVTAVTDGKNLEARLALANASLMAGISFSNSMVGLVHSIAHALGGVAHVPHGDAIAVMLPHVLRYNKEVCNETYSQLLLYMAGEDEYANTPKEKRADVFIQKVEELFDKLASLCTFSRKLTDNAVPQSQLNLIAEKALNDGSIIVNPKPADKDTILQLLGKAY